MLVERSTTGCRRVNRENAAPPAESILTAFVPDETSSDAAAIREPTSRLLSSIDKLKEGPLPIAEPVILAEDFDAFDYGDEDDDEARLASQARRLEEQSRKLEAEKSPKPNRL